MNCYIPNKRLKLIGIYESRARRPFELAVKQLMRLRHNRLVRAFH